ncbi:MAG: glycosyltransferase family 2 protein, partial [Bacillota bacterium]
MDTLSKSTNLVSVIIPSYQSSGTITRAISSAQNQDYENLEIIVVDNGSTDSTHEIVQKAMKEDPRIRCLRLEENRRPAGGRNAGVEVARGEYIGFLDSDDAWLPGKISIQVSLLNNYLDYDLVFTDSWLIFEHSGKRIKHSTGNESILSCLEFHPIEGYESTYFISGPVTQKIYSKSFINMSTSLMRRDRFLQTGGFDQDRFGTEDIDFWVRFSKISKFIYWHQPTTEC